MKQYFKALPTAKVNGLLTGLKAVMYYFKALPTALSQWTTDLAQVNEAFFQSTVNR